MHPNMSFYDLSCIDGYGKRVSFEQFRGKVVVIVNVASICGFTFQYQQFQALYEKFNTGEDSELVILAFPCNQFGRQEPLNGVELTNDIKNRFKITFLIMAKVNVNGHNASPVYKYIKPLYGGYLGFHGIKWNFEKFIIDKHGKVVVRYASIVSPKMLEPLIEKLINNVVIEDTTKFHITANLT